MGRVGDELAVDASDAHGTQRAVPRDVADHERGARAQDAQDVRVVFAVGTEDDGLDLHLVVHALGKERADGAVGEAAGENFLFGRTAFTLEVATGETARRSGLLTVIHGEREKILAGLGLGGGDGRDDDDGFAELHGDRAVRLFGELAGFDDDLFVAHLGCYFFWHNCLCLTRRPGETSVNTRGAGAD